MGRVLNSNGILEGLSLSFNHIHHLGLGELSDMGAVYPVPVVRHSREQQRYS
jgi:hypothetical protein